MRERIYGGEKMKDVYSIMEAVEGYSVEDEGVIEEDAGGFLVISSIERYREYLRNILFYKAHTDNIKYKGMTWDSASDKDIVRKCNDADWDFLMYD
jgi:hypothetical protein